MSATRFGIRCFYFVISLSAACIWFTVETRSQDIQPFDFEIEYPQAKAPLGNTSKLTSAQFPALDLLVWQQLSWLPGDTLNVCFYAGNINVVKRIANAVKDWGDAANINFNFGDGVNVPTCTTKRRDYQVRVGFSCDGNWSLVGQQSLDETIGPPPSCAGALQSLNLAHADAADIPDIKFKGAILHEFGHALGFKHEHQNPNGPCSSDLKFELITLTLLNPPYKWTVEHIKNDFAVDDDLNDANASTKFDPDSIMMYALPKQWVKDGSPCFVSERKGTLSELDKEKAKNVYGGVGQEKQILAQRIANIDSALTTFTVFPSEKGINSFAVDVFASIVETSDNFELLDKRVVPKGEPSNATRDGIYKEFLANKRAEYRKIIGQ